MLVEGGELVVRVHPSKMTEKIRAAVMSHRADIASFLQLSPERQAHLEFLMEGLQVFPGSAVEDPASWEAFKALAQRHFSNEGQWERIRLSCEGLAQVISELHDQGDRLAEALAVYCWYRLEQVHRLCLEDLARRGAAA